MKVIILAGGKATRLPKSAKNIPKSLVKIGKKTILQHQIDLLKKHGLTDIRFSLGYMADQIIEHMRFAHGSPTNYEFNRITNKLKWDYVIEPKPLGTGGAIKFAAKDLKQEFVVLNGDVLSNINFSEFIKSHKKNKSLASIAAWYCKNCCDYGMLEIKNNKITNFLEKPQKVCAGYINAGFYILSPSIFINVSRETFSIENDIFPKLAQNNDLAAYIYKGYWTDVGTEERLKEARRYADLMQSKNA